MKKPFLLAPMAEISHRVLRELIEHFGGCDEYFTEMINSGSLVAGGPFEEWYTDNGPVPEKTVYQLVGHDIQNLVKAAALLDKRECAGIDINMGCCAPIIRKTGAGIAWMNSIDRAGELIGAIRKTVKRRLSVKLRIGFRDDPDYLLRFCRRLQDEGLDLITLHPRTAHEKFKRRARWEYVDSLRRELSIPVAGNGDITTSDELLSRASGPCDAVMVGRAAVRQPWIFAEAHNRGEVSPLAPALLQSKSYATPLFRRDCSPESEQPSPEQAEFPGAGTSEAQIKGGVTTQEWSPPIEETGLRFLELLSRHQPPEFHISRARRFFSFFCENLKWGTYLRNLLNREESLAGIERMWRNYFREQQ